MRRSLAGGFTAGFLSGVGVATADAIYGAIAAFGLGGSDDDASAASAMVLGVFLGSALWWLILTGAVGLVRRRLTPRMLRLVNVVAGAALLGFGLLALAGVLAPT